MSELRPYQEFGADWLLKHPSRLLADDMGLGKTAQACVALNSAMALDERRTLVVCPANLRINWTRELATWSKHLTADIALGNHWPKRSDIVVISYNMLIRWHVEIRREQWAVVALDEAHYLKTLDSQRTKQVRGGFGVSPIRCERKWAITGTPMLNRPIELYPILKWLNVPWAPKEVEYGRRYCGGFGNGFRGASNTKELRANLATVMLRRTKAEVLTELPPKTRQLIPLELGADGEALIAEEMQALHDAGMSYNDFVSGMKTIRIAWMEEGVIARLRRAVGMLKIKASVEHILDVLDDGVEKVIVFAHHRDVIAGLACGIADGLCDAGAVVTLTGSDTAADRQWAVDNFQENPKCRVFIGNIQAAGVGITLTAASHVVFVERDWTPGNNTQAEDRAHRFGQKNHVLVQHLVLDRSLDSYMAKSVVAKQKVLDAIFN